MDDQRITIVEYNGGWVDYFVEFKQELQRVLQPTHHNLILIEHIGSTSVPNLAAKNMIDILIAAPSLQLVNNDWVPLLQELGYQYFPQHETVLPMRRYFSRKKGTLKAIIESHLHIVEPTSQFWREHIAFRDYLRTHPPECAQYEKLKKHNAELFPYDTGAYTDAKGDFITDCVKKALESD